MEITGVFLIVPALVLVLGVLLVGGSLLVSLRRRRAWKGWAEASGTVTGVLHGPDGVFPRPASIRAVVRVPGPRRCAAFRPG
ncbi:hypothetical protein [Arthrobacter sp. B1805]|uniref:hypothetical protein n=1 Tax=Arthrobacter sp. B1805 TaxID=2058892 RepID=UPI000CE34426|nr:hypothetical protein [Arthrobacter sp. B1805]